MLLDVLCSVLALSNVLPQTTASFPELALRAMLVPVQPDDKPDIEHFTVRKGYRVSVAVEDLPGARFMEFDDKGTLFVSRPDYGDIIAFTDKDKDGVYETRATYVSGKQSVHGLCFHKGYLWFSTTGSIHKSRDTDGDGKADEVIDVLPVGSLPRKGGHWWRSLLVTDDLLYTSIGDAANISDQASTERQKIWTFDLDGKNKKLFCSGIRNTEKLRLRPGTTEVWGSDHGSDDFGAKVGSIMCTDSNPPEEFNKYVQDGFYGHPFVVGNRLPRYEYMDRKDIKELCDKTIVPEWCSPAHWAINGFTFIDPAINEKTKGMPADHSGDAFVAAHGSWNSTTPVGYCVARILFDEGKPYGMLKIVSTLEGAANIVRARPVDCVQAPDGSILFSSDAPAGRVFRIRYVGQDAGSK